MFFFFFFFLSVLQQVYLCAPFLCHLAFLFGLADLNYLFLPDDVGGIGIGSGSGIGTNP
jgi:hypothetical protein